MNETVSHFQILESIGAGGMGQVYKAFDTKLKRTVALKFLSHDLTDAPEARARLLREAQSAANLNHPNICTIYEVQEVRSGERIRLDGGEELPPGTPFIAMELIEGTPLDRILAGPSPMDVDAFLDIAIQIAEGLADAHERGIIHRDLKPQNVMVTQKGLVKILDFGLAKPVAGALTTSRINSLTIPMTLEGTLVGTVAYMSPEQAMGKEVDARSDIFSFGVMLYEMVVGRCPFRGETPLGILTKLIETEPEPPSGSRPDLPAEVERIILRCLRKNPENRFSSTRNLLEALKKTRSSGNPPSAEGVSKQTSRLEARANGSRPGLRRAGLVALGLVTVFIVLWSTLGRNRSSIPRAELSYQQVTFSGTARSPALSPDGQFVAYFQQEGDQTELVTHDLAGGNPLTVLQAHYMRNVRWSPDGSHLLLATATKDFAEKSTYLVPRLGGTPRPFTYYPFLAFSQEGSRFVGSYGPSRRIWFTELSSGDTTSIGLKAQYTFLLGIDGTPGADLFLYHTELQGTYSVWTITADGDHQYKVLEESQEIISPRFSPKGDAIYYVVVGGSTNHVFKVSIEPGTGQPTGEPVSVISNLEGADEISLARDGAAMVYTKTTLRSNLWLVDVAGPILETRQITKGTQSDWFPTFSPDGEHIAFSREMSGKANIFTISLEDDSPHQLTFLDGQNSTPAWSPDGKRIAFASKKGRDGNVLIVGAEGGNPSPAGKTQTDMSSDRPEVEWTPSSRILYLKSKNSNYTLLDPDTGEETPLIQGESEGWVFYAKISPDEKWAALSWNRKSGGLWLVSLEDSSQVLLRESSDEVRPVGWSSGGDWVYFKDGSQILRASVISQGLVEIVFALPFDNVTQIAMNGDGSRFVCAVQESESDIWLVENIDPD